MTHSTASLPTRPITDCATLGCLYNQTVGQMNNVGYCVCQQQFCKEHFKTHQCFQAFQEHSNNFENRLLTFYKNTN